MLFSDKNSESKQKSSIKFLMRVNLTLSPSTIYIHLHLSTKPLSTSISSKTPHYFFNILQHSIMSNNEAEHREEEETPAVEDEDTGAQVAPIVKLEQVAVTTGEENEDPILDLRSKLYRFDKDGNQWKERGVGTVKLLKHKESGKVRLVMRQAKTLKICANHLVISTMTVQEHAGSEKSCLWHAADFADGEVKDELFCIRFPTVEDCKKFMETTQEVAESQKTKEENQDASTAAELLEKLSVEDKAKEETKEESSAGVEEEEKKPESSEKDNDTPAASST